MLACAAVAVIGWLAAAFGGASGAVRAGATVWLVAHKTGVRFADAPISIAPLGLTLFLGWCLYRGGRFTARVSGADKPKDLATAAGVLAVTYGLGALIIAVFTSDGTLKVSPLSAFLGAATLALIAGTVGLLVESGVGADMAEATPQGLRDAIPAAMAAVLTVVAIASVLYAVLLAIHFSRVTSMLELLDPGVVGSVVLFAICLMLLPERDPVRRGVPRRPGLPARHRYFDRPDRGGRGEPPGAAAAGRSTG